MLPLTDLKVPPDQQEKFLMHTHRTSFTMARAGALRHRLSAHLHPLFQGEGEGGPWI